MNPSSLESYDLCMCDVCVTRLVDCLKDFGPGDWQLAGQVCQALWNMIGGGSEKLLDTQEGESLLEILTTYLGWCSSVIPNPYITREGFMLERTCSYSHQWPSGGREGHTHPPLSRT